MTKTVYSYDPATGKYTGTTVADESPLEPGVYLLPAHSTETPPPEVGEHEAALWDGETWSLVPDWRGETRYRTDTGEAVHITELGPLPEGVTDVAPPDGDYVWDGGAWALPLEVARGRKIAEIQAASTAAFRAMQAGYSEGEVASFEQQKLGARAILALDMADENAVYVCGLADLRVQYGDVQLGALEGAERYTAFATRIEANVQASMTAGKMILGIQQGLEVRARLAATPEELAAIVWPE